MWVVPVLPEDYVLTCALVVNIRNEGYKENGE